MRHGRHLGGTPQAETRFPGYRLIGMREVGYRNWSAADWEFTWNSSGPAHVIDRFVATPDGRQFAIYWQSAEDRWEQDLPYWRHFIATFRLS
jgi:hypothetical protein